MTQNQKGKKDMLRNKDILECQFESMKAWIDYMHSFGKEEYLWLGGEHYGDWLAMDGDEYIGATSADYIASAFFAVLTASIYFTASA